MIPILPEVQALWDQLLDLLGLERPINQLQDHPHVTHGGLCIPKSLLVPQNSFTRPWTKLLPMLSWGFDTMIQNV